MVRDVSKKKKKNTNRYATVIERSVIFPRRLFLDETRISRVQKVLNCTKWYKGVMGDLVRTGI